MGSPTSIPITTEQHHHTGGSEHNLWRPSQQPHSDATGIPQVTSFTSHRLDELDHHHQQQLAKEEEHSRH